MPSNSYGWMNAGQGASQNQSNTQQQMPAYGQSTFNPNQYQATYNPQMGGQQQNIPSYLQSPNQQGMPQGQGGFNPNGFSPQQGGFQYNAPSPGNPNGAFNPLSNFSQYQSQEGRLPANSYSDNYLQPYLNYQLQLGDQAFNQQYNTWNANQQAMLNQFGMGQQNAATGLNYAAFNAGLGQYADTSAQNWAGLGLTGQNYQNQYNLGLGQNQNQATAIANQYALGQLQNTTQQQGQNQQFTLGQQANLNAMQNYQNQFALGNAANANQSASIANQFTLGQGQLGQGQQSLNLQKNQQEFSQGYSNRALQQEADLMREKYMNDLIQSRYGAFGRAQVPNFRQSGGWR